MSWLLGLGVGVLAGAIIVGLTFFHGKRLRGGAGNADCPLDDAGRRQLGYTPIGPNALRRLQGAVPVIFEWQPQPLWRIAASDVLSLDLDGPAEQALLTRMHHPAVRQTDRALEVVGGDGADPVHHASAAELLCLLTR